MSRTAAALLATLLPVPAVAQLGLSPDLSFGAHGDGSRTAAALVHRLDTGGDRFWLGFGARGTAYAGDAVTFASRSDEPGTFDGDVVIDPSLYGLNLFGEVGWQVSSRFGLGFNLDLFGIATGPDRATVAGVTSPSALSLFLYGNNDRGSLNSELFITLGVSGSTLLRAGFSHYVLGYESAGNASFDATRFQRFQDAAFIAVRLGG